MPGASPEATPKFWEQAQAERSMSEFVSISSPVSEFDTLTRAGDYVRVWRVEGVAFEAAEPAAAADWHESLCNTLRNLPGGQASVYHHRVQRLLTDRLQDPPSAGFARDFSLLHHERLAGKPFLSKELYLTLLYRPSVSRMAHKLSLGRRSKVSIAESINENIATMEARSLIVERTLKEFGLRRLGFREEPDGDTYWEAGELFSFLVNGVWRKVRVPSGPAWKTLPDGRMTFNGGQLQLRVGERRRYVSMLDVKEFDAEVEPGTFAPLLYEPYEYIETQCLALMPRRQALAALTLQRNQLLASDDVATTQIQQMDDALDAVGDGRIQMGEYSYSLAVFGDSPAEASAAAGSIVGAVAESSAMELVPVDLVADAAWFAQLPGNFKWRSRKATISTRAFAALACCHNLLRGKRDGNPWGEALALMRTPAGQPFYLNLHSSPLHEDSEGKKLPGNTILVGQTGSGKTTLLCALLTLTRKWKTAPRIVSFSLHRDTDILIRALGGRVVTFERNVPTGINPFQREPNEQRIAHWTSLVKWCIQSPELPLLPHEEAVIADAVRSVADMPAQHRWMRTVRQSLTRDGRNSLYDRLGKWCNDGELAWVFDQAPDSLGDIHLQPALGFDYTGIASSDDVRTPVMMELFHVMGDLIDGTPFIYHVAEAWRALGDPVFEPFVKTQQKTIRKANGLGIFDTQEVGDLTNSANGRTMIEQSVTKLVLPNSDAQEKDYVDGLGLTRSEFELVRTLGSQGSRRFLCKQGTSTVQCEFDLGGADDMLTVLSATVDNVELLDEIRASVGDRPEDWLPVLYRRVRERRGRSLRRVA